ncbi:MAG TPA: methyltransferase domain-containing protein [Vicinamibacterales bacterium]|nr:methyltransferase domain-containing protein [Vicinamibacterales bacterium]
MKFSYTATPVVVVNCRLAALAVMRSLGPLGVPLYGVDGDPSAPALRSRYCRGRFLLRFDEEEPAPFLEGLLAVGRYVGRAILIPTSDETTQFVADNAGALREYFLFQDNPPELVRQLASKREMFALAVAHGVPTPDTRFPGRLEDVLEYAAHGVFPVMLKGIYGNRLELRTQKKMAVVQTPEELIAAYRAMEDPDRPNLMLQEYIPGGDDQVHMFNGYFNNRSECLLGFTGFKIRQFPVHVGCTSLGECRWNEEVATTTTRFMRAVGYRGILDIGYRLDPRDGRYKVLDINPRIGQAFRLFVSANDHDVARALYLDFTGQAQPPATRRDGRRWLIEDFDLISSYRYYREGTLGPVRWLRSFRGVEEGAWFSWRDPRPFLAMAGSMTGRAATWARRRLSRSHTRSARREGHAARPAAAAVRPAAAAVRGGAGGAFAGGLKEPAKRFVRQVVPLPVRQRLALAIHRQRWIPAARRQWWALELIRDWSEHDVDTFHRFLWSNHLAYAATYEPEARFGSDKMALSRTMFFFDLQQRLARLGLDPARDIHSVFEVGCSLGYQLRHMETSVFPHAAELAGIDIDRHAIGAGSEYLRAVGSRVSIRCADVDQLEELLSGKTYDLIVCTGVLMYLTEARAAAAVRAMLRHARLVALSGLAHPVIDNSRMQQPDVRGSDATFIHNLDRMVERGGGVVRGRRWEGSRSVDGNTIYFVFAAGAPAAAYSAGARLALEAAGGV